MFTLPESMNHLKALKVLMPALTIAVGCAAQPVSKDADVRARQIVSQMTLPEKIAELHGLEDQTHYRYVPPIPRPGIPAFHVANGPCGIGPAGDKPQKPATALPAPISLAATWDVSLAYRYGEIIGEEAGDLNKDLLEGPDVNIARVPQNGRTFEAFGEDPYLVSQLAVSQIRGIQNEGIIANVKHFAANNQEVDRFNGNSIVDERALREIYLPAFEASVKDGHVASIMGAYPKLNGHFCCENDELLNQILKKEWGFDGFVTSDFGAVHSTVPSALGGLDLEMPNGKYFGTPLENAVNSNQVPMSVIDDKLIRRFRKMIEFGMFDHAPSPKPILVQANGAEARRLAEEGMVLLKNDGKVLPLDATKLSRIAVIGPYAAKAMTGGGGSSHVIPPYSVEPVDGIQRRAGTAAKVEFADGHDVAAAVALAKAADVAIVMVGDNEGEDHDHKLTLAGNQDELVEAVAAANTNTIVVVKSGSAIFMPWVNQVPALLEAWYPGEEDGNAVAAVLFGDVNPSGRLPLTFPRKLADLPANTPEQYPGVKGQVHYSEGVFVGYRHYDARGLEPLFPFGFGLSYSTFGYTDLFISCDHLSASALSKSPIIVGLDLTNAGKRDGKEVVQLYVGMPSSADVAQPPKQLKAFKKVPLLRGQTGHVHLELNARSFSCWNIHTHAWEIMPGTYRVMVGASSRDIRLAGTLQIIP
jgi:beta-glucosidase